ncbi:MAG TPA: hypothetical protein VGW38_16010 [Chloroflexota bacterium]|nr:hypothetical protein [Chloroflexota bacterium]
MRWSVALAVVAVTFSAPAAAAEISPVLQSVRTFAATHGDLLWPGYGSAPFGFLLLEEDKETLLCQPGTPQGFTAEGTDPVTGCARWSRPRSGLPSNLLAAMPVLGPPSTIVMGTSGATGQGRPAWLRTVLHEHFHQWQSALPDYYRRVEALDLSGGDRTGMWMLNYAFPYESAAAASAYSDASTTLAEALALRERPGFLAAFDRYLAARARMARSVSTRDWRYLEFQLWQEGTARWTEIQLGKMYPDEEVRQASITLERRTLTQLSSPALATQRRELAYPLGAGEAMLMSACGPAWRSAYPSVLSHGPLLKIARAACPRS